MKTGHVDNITEKLLYSLGDLGLFFADLGDFAGVFFGDFFGVAFSFFTGVSTSSTSGTGADCLRLSTMVFFTLLDAGIGVDYYIKVKAQNTLSLTEG